MEKRKKEKKTPAGHWLVRDGIVETVERGSLGATCRMTDRKKLISMNAHVYFAILLRPEATKRVAEGAASR
jgi:hypothetical protein